MDSLGFIVSYDTSIFTLALITDPATTSERSTALMRYYHVEFEL